MKPARAKSIAAQNGDSPLLPSPERAVQAAKDSVYRALASMDTSIRLAFIAGQRLNELKGNTLNGDFADRRKQMFPDIAERTFQSWQRCAAIILEQVRPPALPSVADILEIDETALPAEALEFRRAWDDFISDKSLRQILSEAALGKDDTGRPFNGKLKGGTNKHDDRKDFPLFAANSLKVLSGHISHWNNLDEDQKNEIKNAFSYAISGSPLTLQRPDFSRTAPFSKPWPLELTKFLMATIKKSLKLSNDNHE
jgi:hypothetical protein